VALVDHHLGDGEHFLRRASDNCKHKGAARTGKLHYCWKCLQSVKSVLRASETMYCQKIRKAKKLKKQKYKCIIIIIIIMITTGEAVQGEGPCGSGQIALSNLLTVRKVMRVIVVVFVAVAAIVVVVFSILGPSLHFFHLKGCFFGRLDRSMENVLADQSVVPIEVEDLVKPVGLGIFALVLHSCQIPIDTSGYDTPANCITCLFDCDWVSLEFGGVGGGGKRGILTNRGGDKVLVEHFTPVSICAVVDATFRG